MDAGRRALLPAALVEEIDEALDADQGAEPTTAASAAF